ncbi:MAG: hypothetical protein AAGU05_12050, partial [Anaerolineaceae bacterium]
MYKRIVTGFLLICFILSFNITTVNAQSYSFTVPTAKVTFSIEADGSATIEYIYVFANDNGAPAIEFIDIGMPAGSNYSYSDMTGEIDGKAISHIKSSEYISNGVEFGLGSNAIPAGRTGTFHATLRNVRGVVFPGTAEESESYAGSQFQPNYFESSAVSGKTDMTVTIVLPPGATDQEGRYYEPENWPGDKAPQSGFLDDRIFYTWNSTDARTDRQYVFGAAFPARLIPGNTIAQPPANNTFDNNGSGAVSISIGDFIDNISGFACCG